MRSIRERFEGATRASAWLAVAAAACSRDLAAPIPARDAAPEEARRGGTLHLSELGDARNLDPAGPTDGVSLSAIHLIFAGLVDFDGRANVVPDLAESWEIEDGGLSYRFTLRPGVTMHDGAELTSDDVARSVERALHPSAPNPTASALASLVGFDDFTSGRADSIAGVSVEGRYVVRFRLKEPDATFLPLLAMTALRPVCKDAGRRYSDTWHPCGAGPFRLPAGGWQRGASLRLVRHDAYFRPGLPHLDAVEWTFNMHPLAQRFRFESGDVDLLRDITQADQRRFAADPRWIPLGHADADTTLYGEAMNTTMAPFDNVEVRRAVACAVNREHYRLLKPSSMTVVTQVIPPDIPGYDPATPGQHYDPAEALEHMRKAGYPYDPVTGRGGWPRTIEYPIYDQGLLLLTAQLLQQDLAKIGLRIDLRLVSWEAFLTLQGRASGATLSQGNWQMDYPDPSSFFDSLFSTRSIAPEGGSNIAFYSNPRVDALLAEARRESSPEARRGLYAKADSIVCDEAPWAFTYSHHAYRVRQPYVMGQVTHPVWGLDPTTAWLDRTGRSVEQALVPGLRR